MLSKPSAVSVLCEAWYSSTVKRTDVGVTIPFLVEEARLPKEKTGEAFQAESARNAVVVIVIVVAADLVRCRLRDRLCGWTSRSDSNVSIDAFVDMIEDLYCRIM